MGKNNNIIEINGKQYDARTGAMLSAHDEAETPLIKPETGLSSPKAKKSMHDVVRQPAMSARAHQPKPSKTLMRHAVHRPTPSKSKQKLKAQGPSEVSANDSLATVVVSKSAKRFDHKKLAKASRVPQSRMIAHFGSVTSDINSPEPVAEQAKPAAGKPNAARPTHATKTKPKTTAELLDHAVQQAKSHEAEVPKTSRRTRRSTKLALASMTAVLLIAFVGYQELPKLQFSLASAKAGFGATLPSYQPAGYSIGKLTYSPGVVAAKFNSNSDQRNYTLTQKTSSWDSHALKDNFVVNTSSDYQTVETAGQTIYLYGNGNATWVNGGIWYIVRSNGSLSDQQLIEVAKSI